LQDYPRGLRSGVKIIAFKMKSNNQNTQPSSPGLSKFLQILIKIFLVFVLMALAFFLPAGTFHFTEAWIYLIMLGVAFIIVLLLFAREKSGILWNRLSRRREKQEGGKKIQSLFSLFFILALLLPGFDHRMGWSDVPMPVFLAADALVLLGYAFIVLSMSQNRYATAIIEIQEGQKVMDQGLYKIVRHPMYTGGLLFLLFSPIALGSYWGLIPFLLVPALLVKRIKEEEKLLQAELPGYNEYYIKTRYRLLPFIW